MFNPAELESPAQGKEPCVLCLTILIITMGGGYWQWVVLAGVILALSVIKGLAETTASIGFDRTHVAYGQSLSVDVHVDYDGTGNAVMTVEFANGQTRYELIESATSNHYFPVDTYGVAWADDFWVKVTINNLIVQEACPLVRLIGLTPYAGSEETSAVAVGQQAAFLAVFSNYAGNQPGWAPGELWFDGVQGSCEGWAWSTWGSAHEETVTAWLIGTGLHCNIYVVSATIKSVTFTGADYAAVNKDSDGVAYATPHYDGALPTYRPPVQCRRGSRPTMDLEFEISPPEYTGPFLVRALTSLLTPTNSATPNFGLAQFLSIQTIDSLTDSVGHDENFSLNWDFSVAANAFYPAGSSGHNIYRTLATPVAKLHTVVHTACHDVGGDSSTILCGIWSKFAGLNITTWAGLAIKYYGAGETTPHAGGTAGLIRARDGQCGDWAAFFIDVLSVHGLEAINRSVSPYKETIAYNGEPYRAGKFIIRSLAGQNNPSLPVIPFEQHQLVEYNGEYYDPSYGTWFAAFEDWDALRVWEESSVLGYIINVTTETGIIETPVPNPESTSQFGVFIQTPID